MDAYLTILFVVHIGGAILGLGPTGAFSVMGKMAATPGYGLALIDAMVSIESKIVTPVALITQPVSGVLLIAKTGRDKDFFGHTWLWVAILLYAIILGLSYFSSLPRLKRMVAMMKAGDTGSPELQKLIGIENKIGPVFGVLFVIIIVLMIWKPGD
jgi:uncharacterized membrane protein